MRTALIIAALTVMVLLVAGPPLVACGDKLLVLGRGFQFKNVNSDYPAVILHYMHSQNTSSADLTDKEKLKPLLTSAGHKLDSFTSARDFEVALRTGKYELVLIDAGDVLEFEEAIQSAPSKPFVLPFVNGGTKKEIAAAKRRFEVVLQAPARGTHLLEKIEIAMEKREKRQRKEGN